MFASADTNFLLGLAAQEEDAVDAAETLRRRAPHLLISATPTPLEELRFFKVQSQDLELKAAAAKALASFRSVWGFHAVSLTSSQQERVEQVADHIRQVGIL